MEDKNDIFKGLEDFLVKGLNEENLYTDPTLDKPVNDPEPEQEPEPNPGAVSQDELEEELRKQAGEDDPEPTPAPEKGEEVVETGKETLYKTLSQELIDSGIIEKEFTSPEEMMNSFKEIIDSNINDWVESLPEELQDLVSNYREGVPFDELLKIKSDEIRLDSISEESLEDSVDTQKSLYRQYLKATTKFSDARIDKEITKAEDLGELLDNAKEGLGELKELKKAELAEAKAREAENRVRVEKERTQMLQQIDKVVKETKEIIPGVKLTEKEQKELYKMITSPQEVRGNQAYTAAMIAREKDPIAFEMKLNYFIKQGFFDEGAKFDKIVKKVETKNLANLEKEIEAMSKRNFNKAGNHAPESKNNTLEALKSMQFKK